MGNWRTVTITGSIDAADVPAARAFVELGDRPVDWDRFHCLCWTGPSLCGLGRWIPKDGGQIDAVGNLAERDYGVEEVAETLRNLVAVAPSLDVKVHCGGDWENTTCVATVTAREGQVTISDPEVAEVGGGLEDLATARLGAIMFGRGVS